jgi:xanthine phosphoribosyltransferase
LELLKERILREARVLPGHVVLVDAFINQQIDPELAQAIGVEFARRFAGAGVTRVLTAEASGIAFGLTAALALGVPMVFARKHVGSNQTGEMLMAPVRSYTHGGVNHLTVSKRFILPGDRVLIVDDFMAMGEAARGLVSITEQAGATVAGVGIVIEKAFQPGGESLREAGYRVEALARIAAVKEDGSIILYE